MPVRAKRKSVRRPQAPQRSEERRVLGGGKYINRQNKKIDMRQEMITIPKIEYEKLKEEANLNEELLVKLVRGLEDIRAGRIKLWKNKFNRHPKLDMIFV